MHADGSVRARHVSPNRPLNVHAHALGRRSAEEDEEAAAQLALHEAELNSDSWTAAESPRFATAGRNGNGRSPRVPGDGGGRTPQPEPEPEPAVETDADMIERIAAGAAAPQVPGAQGQHWFHADAAATTSAANPADDVVNRLLSAGLQSHYEHAAADADAPLPPGGGGPRSPQRPSHSHSLTS